MGERLGRKRSPDDVDAFEIIYNDEENGLLSPLEGDESDFLGMDDDSDSMGLTGGGRDMITRSPSTEPISLDDTLRVSAGEGKKNFATKTKNTLILGTKFISPKKFKGKKDTGELVNFQTTNSSPNLTRRERKKEKRESESIANNNSNLHPSDKNKDKSEKRDTKKGSRIWRRKDKSNKKTEKEETSSYSQSSAQSSLPTSASSRQVSSSNSLLSQHLFSYAGSYDNYDPSHPGFLPYLRLPNDTIDSPSNSPPRSPRSAPSFPTLTPTGSPLNSPRSSSPPIPAFSSNPSVIDPQTFIPPPSFYTTSGNNFDSSTMHQQLISESLAFNSEKRFLREEIEALDAYELSNTYFIENVMLEHLNSNKQHQQQMQPKLKIKQSLRRPYSRSVGSESDNIWVHKAKEYSSDDLITASHYNHTNMDSVARRARSGTSPEKGFKQPDSITMLATKRLQEIDTKSKRVANSDPGRYQRADYNNMKKSDDAEEEKQRTTEEESSTLPAPKVQKSDRIEQIYPPPGMKLHLLFYSAMLSIHLYAKKVIRICTRCRRIPSI